MTLSEASALRWKDVDLEQKTITVRYFIVTSRRQETPEEELSMEEVSGRRQRKVPIPDPLAKRLSEIRNTYLCGEDDFVIASPQKKPVSMERLRAILFRRSQRVGFKKVTPRMLRDTYAIHAVQAGATSDMIAELMGFASAQQVVRRYMPRTAMDKHALVNRMYKY